MFLVFPSGDGEAQREATSVYFGLNARNGLCNQNINNNQGKKNIYA